MLDQPWTPTLNSTDAESAQDPFQVTLLQVTSIL